MKLVEDIYITSVELVENHLYCLRETSIKSIALVSKCQNSYLRYLFESVRNLLPRMTLVCQQKNSYWCLLY
jgi:hypothetical protein